jgi:Phage terminase, small subunit
VASIVREYDVSDAAGVEMLAQACAALDRAESCRELIDEHGEAGVTKTGIRENPLMKVEQANRSFVVRTLERLGLNSEPAKSVGRPTESWSREKAEVENA